MKATQMEIWYKKKSFFISNEPKCNINCKELLRTSPKSLCPSYIHDKLFQLQISKAKNMDDVSLDLEMVLRMFFRSLLWEVVGSDFANRAVSN